MHLFKLKSVFVIFITITMLNNKAFCELKIKNCKYEVDLEATEQSCFNKCAGDEHKINKCIEQEIKKVEILNNQIKVKSDECKQRIDFNKNKLKKMNYNKEILYYFNEFNDLNDLNYFNNDNIQDSLDHLIKAVYLKNINKIECIDSLYKISALLTTAIHRIKLYSLAQYLLKVNPPEITLDDLNSIKDVHIYPEGELKDTTDGEIFLAYFHLMGRMKYSPDYTLFINKISSNRLLSLISYCFKNEEKLRNGDTETLKAILKSLFQLNGNEKEILFNWQDFYYVVLGNTKSAVYRQYDNFEQQYQSSPQKNTNEEALFKYRDVLSKNNMIELTKIFKEYDKIQPDEYKYLERLNDPENEYLRQKEYREKQETQK